VVAARTRHTRARPAGARGDCSDRRRSTRRSAHHGPGPHPVVTTVHHPQHVVGGRTVGRRPRRPRRLRRRLLPGWVDVAGRVVSDGVRVLG
jgi:hypothetical protein